MVSVCLVFSVLWCWYNIGLALVGVLVVGCGLGWEFCVLESGLDVVVLWVCIWLLCVSGVWVWAVAWSV